ncbi:DUF6368 family protein [Streptomyces sp. NPDC046862]|uniref:DUF6368 family protein n=1 Tax=Streptomyces sp. NPDC046862 TaxID=3154603 RepID=UPI0034515FC6
MEEDVAGPAASLWLFEKRDHDDVVRELRPWMETFCHPVQVERDGALCGWVQDGCALGAPEIDTSRCGPLTLCRENHVPEEPDELFADFERRPVQELVWTAGTRGRSSHLLLGYLMLALSRRFDTLIDFGGLLGYRYSIHQLPPDEEEHRLAESRRLVAGLPGKVWELPNETHVADSEFLATWLQHPKFHMIN